MSYLMHIWIYPGEGVQKLEPFKKHFWVKTPASLFVSNLITSATSLSLRICTLLSNFNNIQLMSQFKVSSYQSTSSAWMQFRSKCLLLALDFSPKWGEINSVEGRLPMTCCELWGRQLMLESDDFPDSPPGCFLWDLTEICLSISEVWMQKINRYW